MRLSVCPHLEGGAPARSRWGGGVPKPGPGGGVPQPGRYPDRGYPTSGTPHQTWWGVPQPGPGGGYPSQVQVEGTPARSRWGVPWWGYQRWGTTGQGTPLSDLARGYPDREYPTSGIPLSDLARGYPDRGVPHRVVLDTPRSVCLLRSCRRTFL